MSKSELDDELAGSLAECLAPLEPPAALRARLRERLLAALQPLSAGHVTVQPTAGEWIDFAPGASMKVLREDEQTRSYLLRLAPGARLPPHEHDLDEECMVLEGDVRLGGVRTHAGGYHLAIKGLAHGEIVTEGGCLLFIRGQKHYRSGPAAG